MAAIALPTHDTQKITELENLLTIDQAAELLSKTPSRIRQMIANSNFQTVYELGTRPTYLLDRAEIAALAAEAAE